MLADLFSPQNQQLNQKYPAQALDKIFHRAHWAVLRSRSFSPVPELWVPRPSRPLRRAGVGDACATGFSQPPT
jgi:hypothetical protein